jgi:hypothetical protein
MQYAPYSDILDNIPALVISISGIQAQKRALAVVTFLNLLSLKQENGFARHV